jgi:hypothetical protein
MPRLSILLGLADQTHKFSDNYIDGGWPTVYFMDENMVIQGRPTSQSHWAALDMADAY